MRRHAQRLVRAALFPTLVLLLVVWLAPGRIELAVRVYVLVVCLVALIALLRALRAAYPTHESSLESALVRNGRDDEPLPELTRLEREVALAASNGFDLHFRLRPTLREVASGLLLARRGVDLDARPQRARELLGDETYALVRADLEPPSDRLETGIQADQLERVISSLEELA